MLNYIKNQIAEREKANAITFDDTDNSEIVVECAHLFQELDDISVEGTDATADRPVAVEIPLEDDIEIESVEFNIGDGRLTDVPMDATVQESSNETMKSFDDFYQEAYESTSRLPRESEESFKGRAMRAAIGRHHEYLADAEKKGLFGFNKIDINSDDIPPATKIIVDADGRSVMAPVYWESHGFGHKIDKNQIDALNKFVESDKASLIPSFIVEFFKETYPDEINNFKNIWEVIGTPSLYIPKQKGNPTVIIDYGKTYFTEDGELVWKITIPSSNDSNASIDHINTEPGNIVHYKSFKTKKEIIKEYATRPTRKLSRFGEDLYYQEAIDFGDAANTDEPKDTPAPTDEPSVSVDATEDTGDADTSKNDDTLPVDANDVSDDIAKKVSEDTTTSDPDIDSLDTEEPSLDGEASDIPDDTASDDTSSENDDDADIDGQLDDLNDMGNTDSSVDTEADDDIDFDNMTMDDLLKKGAEKLKGMTMAQLKEFMDGNPDTKIDDTLTQESFFMTTKNINKKMSDQLRVVSGILNDTEMKFEDLVTEFKKQGKSLNKILSKASKAKKIYNDEDREAITKLNSILVDLMNQFKLNPSQNEAIMIKRIIKEFVSRAVAVNDIIERVAGGKTENNNKKIDKETKGDD